MAYSFMTAISDGTLRVMPITFPYMKIEDINVRQNVTLLKAGKDYDINNNVITFRYNIPKGDRIAVDRMSQKASLRVNFLEGATFSRENMDDVLTQLLYLTQEAIEGSVDRVSPTGVLDVNGNRIINLGDPIDLQDAVPLHLVVDAEKSIYASEAMCKKYRDEALGYKDSAFTSADRAYASELDAKSSEIAAANSANSVKGLEVKAQASADAALVSQNAAKVSEDNAKASETNSKASETSALSSKNSAASSATTATNAMNSAKTSETNAKTSATNAKLSENNAWSSEMAAYSSADSVKGLEVKAQASADAALVSQNAAKVSEVNAKNSEIAAKDSADIAASYSDKVVDALAATGNVPVGTIAMMANNASAPPVGWLFCGTTFDKATYPALAKLLPDGRIPDFTNRFPRGAGATAVGAHGAESIPSHTHGVSISGNVSTLAAVTYVTTSSGSYSGTTSSAGNHNHGIYLNGEVNHGGNYNCLIAHSVGSGKKSIHPIYGSGTHYVESNGAHTHTFSVPDHTHSINTPAHNHTFSWSGNTSAYGSGDRVLPYNIGVKFIIKATDSTPVGVDEAREIIEAYNLRIIKVEEGVAEAITDIDKAVSDANTASSAANEATTLANKAVEAVNGYAARIAEIESEQVAVNNTVSELDVRVTNLEQSGGSGGGANEPWKFVEDTFQRGTDVVGYASTPYGYNAPLDLRYCSVLWRWEDDRKAIRIKGRLVTYALDSGNIDHLDNYYDIKNGCCEVISLPVLGKPVSGQFFSYSTVYRNCPLDIRANRPTNSILIGISKFNDDPTVGAVIPAIDITFDWTVVVGASDSLPSL